MPSEKQLPKTGREDSQPLCMCTQTCPRAYGNRHGADCTPAPLLSGVRFTLSLCPPWLCCWACSVAGSQVLSPYLSCTPQRCLVPAPELGFCRPALAIVQTREDCQSLSSKACPPSRIVLCARMFSVALKQRFRDRPEPARPVDLSRLHKTSPPLGALEALRVE